MIKKRNSLNIMEFATRPPSGCTNPDAPSPNKFIRKLTRQSSTVNGSSTKIQTVVSPVSNKSQDVVQQCIAIVEQIRQQYKERQASRFFIFVRAPCLAIGCRSQTHWSTLCCLSLQENFKGHQREIQSVMNQLMEEKQQKQKAIDQRDSLTRRQDYSIKQLKSRIEQFKKLN